MTVAAAYKTVAHSGRFSYFYLFIVFFPWNFKAGLYFDKPAQNRYKTIHTLEIHMERV